MKEETSGLAEIYAGRTKNSMKSHGNPEPLDDTTAISICLKLRKLNYLNNLK